MKIFLHFQIKSGRMDGSSLLQNLIEAATEFASFIIAIHSIVYAPCFGIVTFITLKIESNFLCWYWW